MADNQQNQQRVALADLKLRLQAAATQLDEISARLKQKESKAIEAPAEVNQFASKVAHALNKARIEK